MSDHDTPETPAPKRGRPKRVAVATDQTSAVIEGFRGLVDELKQSRLEAPDVHAKAMKKAMRPSNDAVPGISVFNPRGQKDYPLPDLKCEIMAPYSIHPAYHGLDREEVELFNLLEPGDYEIELADSTNGRVFVKGIFNELTEKLEKLSVSTSPLWTAENKSLFPSMRSMLRQILGEKANQVMPMTQERKLILAGQLDVSVGA